MSFFALSGLINGVTSTALAIFIFAKGRKGLLYKTYVLFCLSVAIWSYFYFAWQIATTETQALIFCRGLMGLKISRFFLARAREFGYNSARNSGRVAQW